MAWTLGEEQWRWLEEHGADTVIGQHILKKTREKMEHPDWYNGPCECKACLQLESAGDA